MPRKPDPKLLALREKLHKAKAGYDRWFSRLKRAVTAGDWR